QICVGEATPSDTDCVDQQIGAERVAPIQVILPLSSMIPRLDDIHPSVAVEVAEEEGAVLLPLTGLATRTLPLPRSRRRRRRTKRRTIRREDFVNECCWVVRVAVNIHNVRFSVTVEITVQEDTAGVVHAKARRFTIPFGCARRPC